jgi:AmiR/NasT family two-component response regulator
MLEAVPHLTVTAPGAARVCRLLVVEDETLIALNITGRLTQRGYIVVGQSTEQLVVCAVFTDAKCEWSVP